MAKASATGASTDGVINYLNSIGFYAWRNNTQGIWNKERQKFIMNKRILKGVPDVLGLDWYGKHVAVEIKRKDDRLSVDQTLFAAEFIARFGMYIISGHIDDVIRSLLYYGYDVAESGHVRSWKNRSLEDRIIDGADLHHIPNANKIKKLKTIEKAKLSTMATGSIGVQNLKLILGQYAERIL
jgi:hypothetical protein